MNVEFGAAPVETSQEESQWKWVKSGYWDKKKVRIVVPYVQDFQ